MFMLLLGCGVLRDNRAYNVEKLGAISQIESAIEEFTRSEAGILDVSYAWKLNKSQEHKRLQNEVPKSTEIEQKNSTTSNVVEIIQIVNSEGTVIAAKEVE
jgi:hypothetical protein